MPFRSQAQMKWAFANKKPWAKEWADKTPNPGSLPLKAEKKQVISRALKRQMGGRGGEIAPTGAAAERLKKLAKLF